MEWIQAVRGGILNRSCLKNKSAGGHGTGRARGRRRGDGDGFDRHVRAQVFSLHDRGRHVGWGTVAIVIGIHAGIVGGLRWIRNVIGGWPIGKAYGQSGGVTHCYGRIIVKDWDRLTIRIIQDRFCQPSGGIVLNGDPAHNGSRLGTIALDSVLDAAQRLANPAAAIRQDRNSADYST